MIMPRVNAEEQKPYGNGGVSVLESLVEMAHPSTRSGAAEAGDG
jgi:hypothetical protein